MSASAEWAGSGYSDVAAPVFGGRRQWLGYAYETTGYGSLEHGGPLAHRVTLVHPDDDDVLRRHHRSVRAGRLSPGWRWMRRDEPLVHVIDRDELVRTGADRQGSWLHVTQRVACLCGMDDEVARTAGPSLRRLLWFGREHLDSEPIAAALTELGRAAEALAEERARYKEAAERWIRTGQRTSLGAADRLLSVAELTRADVESIRLEVRTLAEVRREWRHTGRSTAP